MNTSESKGHVAVTITEGHLPGRPGTLYLCVSELRSRDGQSFTLTGRDLSCPIQGKHRARHQAWLELALAAWEQWGVLVPDSSDPEPVVWS
jgi:hypothetical protein